jgi:hypothetical protein
MSVLDKDMLDFGTHNNRGRGQRPNDTLHVYEIILRTKIRAINVTWTAVKVIILLDYQRRIMNQCGTY